jgi:hypothetical protein
MMNWKKKWQPATAVLSFIFVLILNACVSDQTLQVAEFCSSLTYSYAADIRPIIDSSCAVAGCHVNGGDGEGDFTTYEGLTAKIASGIFQDRVFNIGDMPDTSTGITPLTEVQINQLKCWIQIDYPEN